MGKVEQPTVAVQIVQLLLKMKLSLYNKGFKLLLKNVKRY
jgi:hypothetical protein